MYEVYNSFSGDVVCTCTSRGKASYIADLLNREVEREDLFLVREV